MLKLFACITWLALQLTADAQPGKYAGSKKSLVGKTYTDSRKIPGLTGWQFREGSMISGIDDPELVTVDVFKKGTTWLIIFSMKEDTADTAFTIQDVVEVKGVLSTQHIRTGTCQEGANESGEIVALVKQQNTDYSKAIKAWQYSRDKRRVRVMNSKLVKCMNEGGD